MGQKVKETRLDNKTVRERLKPRGKPYWKRIREGLHLGYRRGLRSGVWVARLYADGKYTTENIGPADNFSTKPAEELLSFDAAQDRLLSLAGEAHKPAAQAIEAAGPYTVNSALDAYFLRLEAEGSKSVADAKSRASFLIRPELGEIPVADLTRDALTKWRNEIAARPRHVRGKHGEAARPGKAPLTDDTFRQRKATANRTLTILKAALNQSFRDGKVNTDATWRAVKPFREVETARVRHFSIEECRRLVNAARGPFRDLINAALFTGCRYGELCALRVRDFNPDSGTLFVEKSKSGKARHVVLTAESQTFFRQLTAGRPGDVIMLSNDGAPWAKSHQIRPMAEACKKARIRPAGFHILRHTYASLLVMAGAPLPVVAQNLGHADTRMTEKHYAHLAPSYFAETIRKFAPALGTVETTNVAAIER
jgi:integrase